MKTILIALIAIIALGLSSCGRSGNGNAPQGDTTAVHQAAEYYTCPMHPQVHSDKPGSCPICHMDLVKASAGAAATHADAGALTVNERGRQLANVATVTVHAEPVAYSLRAFGTLEIPEPNRTMVSARFNGRIEKLYVSAVGAAVKKGQPLFDIYSPDIVQAQNEYVQAFKRAGTEGAPSTLVAASRSKLELFGFTQEQIRSLEAGNGGSLVFTYHSPASGTVIDKKIVEGMYINEGLSLFELSDLSTLWNIADVYEADAGRLHVGDKATVQLQNFPDRPFPGVVSFIYPVVNSQSRTIRVRLTVANASGALRPNTYTETVFAQSHGASLTVPASAVLVTGKRNIVYVSTGENTFEQREVGIGVRFNGKFEITHGLKDGDVVVSEGGYLLDSERQLKTGGGL